MSKNRATEKLFNDLSEFVTEGRLLLKNGQLLELQGLDERVRVLCEQVLILSDDDRVRYGDKLAFLLHDLQHLGDELAVQRDALLTQVQDVPQHQKATMAYRQTDTFAKPDEETEE